jgi:hypothetical protein
MLKYLLILLTSFAGGQIVYGQSHQNERYTVEYLPKKAGLSKATLNKELQSAHDREDVRKVLRKMNLSSFLIIIEVQNNDQTLWWTLHGSDTKTEPAGVVLQSRNITSLRLYKLSDFKNIFRDTLVLLDTLALELYTHDPSYPDDQFCFLYSCGDKPESLAAIPLSKNKLVISNDLFASCPHGPLPVRLISKANPDRIIASSHLLFLDADEKDALRGMADWYRQNFPGSQVKEIAGFVAAYSQTSFGSLYFPQLTAWLEAGHN